MFLQRYVKSWLSVTCLSTFLFISVGAMKLPMLDEPPLQTLPSNTSQPSLGNEIPICVNEPDWGLNIRDTDCEAVVNYMYQHYHSYFFNVYAFTDQDTSLVKSKHVVRTPIKIHHGK